MGVHIGKPLVDAHMPLCSSGLGSMRARPLVEYWLGL